MTITAARVETDRVLTDEMLARFDERAAVTQAFRVVDRALDLSGGAGIFTRNRLERLFRDCRLGRIHPANEMLTHELIGKLALGVDFDDPQRWG